MDIKHMYLDALTETELDRVKALFGSRLHDTDEEYETDDEEMLLDEFPPSVEYHE